jgi:peroxiredoxin
MARISSRLPVLALSFAIAVSASAARVGSPAPAFTGTDTNGQSHSLSDYHGKYVVLEWTNHDCPYTKAQYDSGNMQSLQKEWTAKGVVWLTIISSAPGQQGYMTPAEENSWIAKVHADPTAAILDPSGAIGHAYDAKTTPHMFIIDPSGKLIYDGAIDNNATTDASTVHSSKNYVTAALDDATTGKAVAVTYTRPYGCSVKYAGGE